MKGKVAIITGASRGIGSAVARRLAAEGARLLLNHREDEAAMRETVLACEQAGAEVIVWKADIGEAGTSAELCRLALERFGRIDVLVNNAGVTHESLLATTDDDRIQRMLSVNVMALVWTTRAVLRPMLKQRQGAIVNLSSALATRPGRGNAVYAGSKGFVEAFTRACAVELGRKNIRVNAVAPGVIQTDMTERVRNLAADQIREQVGLARIGTPEEVAEAVAFLASDRATYINGAVLSVDGAYQGGH